MPGTHFYKCMICVCPYLLSFLYSFFVYLFIYLLNTKVCVGMQPVVMFRLTCHCKAPESTGLQSGTLSRENMKSLHCPDILRLLHSNVSRSLSYLYIHSQRRGHRSNQSHKDALQSDALSASIKLTQAKRAV